MSELGSDRCFALAQVEAAGALVGPRWAPPEIAGSARPLPELCRAALDAPLGSPPLAELCRASRRVAVIVSDASRDEPRGAFLDALAPYLPVTGTTLVVASGTHAPGPPEVVPARHRRWPVVVHDGRALDRLVDLGVTSEGTRVRLLREVAEADLVVVTGRVRPHYFAGYSGGVKGIFPGCAASEDCLQNHLLKADPSARLGRSDGNRCRADMEAAAALLPGRAVALNVLCDASGNALSAVFGDPVIAHREMSARADACFVVHGSRTPLLVVADRPPVSSSLYQASKCLPPAAALLEPGGTVVLVAECDQGLGPRERVNEGIYRLGMASQLAPGHRVVLVSQRGPDEVATSYAEHAPSLKAALETALSRHGLDRAPLLWRAGECVTLPHA